MTKHSEALKRFEKQFCYWVVLGSTLKDGSKLEWNVPDGKIPNINKIKAFLLQELERRDGEWEKELVYIKNNTLIEGEDGNATYVKGWNDAVGFLDADIDQIINLVKK